MTSPRTLVRLEGARIGFRGRVLLDGVDLEIRAGEVLGIVGPNGSGKTTLVRTLLGSQRPLRGRCTRAARMGYVPQRGALDPIWPFTVEDVVAMGALGLEERDEGLDRAARDRGVREAMGACGILELADGAFSELSGGQKQRALIARALVADPEILFLDEPTNDLDPKGEHEVMTLAARLRDEGRTLVIVSHALHVVARHAAVIALLHAGRLVVDEAAAILAPERLARIFDLPAEAFPAPTGARRDDAP